MKGSLLVVLDDDELSRKILIDMLKDLDYQCKSFSRGNDFLNWYKQEHQKVAMLVLDMIMPEMNGREVLGHLQKINPYEKVLIVSAYSDNEDMKDLLKKDRVLFMQKPFAKKLLSNAIKQLIGTQGIDADQSLGNNQEKDKDHILNEEDALTRLGISQDVYYSFLKNFVEKYQSITDQIQEDLESERYPEARRLAHSLKGAAANFGAEKLSQSARDLESCCKQEGLSCLSQLKQFKADLQKLCQLIKEKT